MLNENTRSTSRISFVMHQAIMRLQIVFRAVLCAILFSQSSLSFETDQYNLPPQPLADIGVEVSGYTEQNLRKAVDKINAQIVWRQICLENDFEKPQKPKCESPEKERARLDYLQSEAAIAREVYELLGDGIVPFTRSGSWMESHRFLEQPARFKTNYFNSIYFAAPINYLTISSTVRIYGAEFGTDKIAHFFQQGYTYYKIAERAKAQGLPPDKAERKAVRWGQKTERTYYGTLVSGVYSNADLCANYVGMRFYQGLTKPIKIGNETRPPVLLHKNGVWVLNENFNLPEQLIKPFLTEHLNEALNPSIFSKIIGLHAFVRRNVKERSCEEWLRQRPDLNKNDLTWLSEKLTKWYGEDYGFKESKSFITIANSCFDGD